MMSLHFFSELISLFLKVSCQKVGLNLTAVGEDTLVFPEGKVLTMHHVLDGGYEYEVVYTRKSYMRRVKQ